jgi:tetratricopeptide (TPR) repeat protein
MGPRATQSRSRELLVRSLVIFGLALVAFGAAGAVGYHFFIGWRARDLAAEAKDNFKKTNYRVAWLQISSARELRPEEPEVLRVLGLIEGAMGRVSALDYYEKISQKGKLTPEDLQARAEIAVRLGNDGQCAEALGALEKAGKVQEAGTLRAARKLKQGDIERAIAEARATVVASDDPALKLTLARLLLVRYRPEFGPGRKPTSQALAGLAEVIEIVDGLLDTPQRSEALSFALNEVNATPEKRLRWAHAAMDQVTTDNPALLPAAAMLVRSGEKTPQQIHEQFRPIFDAAPLERRAAYALWLTGVGLPNEALTLITAQEAGESTAAFGVRTEALLGTGNLDAVLAAVETGGHVDADVRLAVKARAEYARGRGAQSGAAALREAMDAAAKAGRLELIIPSADALGASAVVDEKLAELCGDPSVVDDAFRVARERFGRSGRASVLAASFKRAQVASPQSHTVEDYGRYLALVGDQPVSLEETAAVSAADPANVNFRITHALNLLRHGQPAEALKSFDDVTVFADRLPPGHLAVIAAVLSANGENERARAAAAAIDADRLTTGEYGLIAPLRAVAQ